MTNTKTKNLIAGSFQKMCLIIMFLLTPTIASASATLDQSSGLTIDGNSAIAIISAQSIAQTLTVGTSGLLAQIDVQIAQSPGTEGDVTLSILDASGGIPGQALGSTVITLAQIPLTSAPDAWTSIDVSDLSLSFDVGDQIAIELSRSGPTGAPWVLWSINDTDTNSGYAAGTAFSNDGGTTGYDPLFSGNSDVDFQTWMDATPIPVPASVWFLASALGLLGVNTPKDKRSS